MRSNESGWSIPSYTVVTKLKMAVFETGRYAPCAMERE